MNPIEVGARVDVNLTGAFFKNPPPGSSLVYSERGTVVRISGNPPHGWTYLVRYDRDLPEAPYSFSLETPSIRWMLGCVVRRVSLLDLMAEAAV